MRVLTLLFIIFLISNFALAQDLKGKYVDGKDYFYFYEKKVEFSIQNEGGFTYPLKGVGKYSIYEDYLVIYISRFDSLETKYYEAEEFEQIVENETYAFKKSSLSEESFSLMLLPVGRINTIVTIKMLKELEKEAQKAEYRVREFSKE